MRELRDNGVYGSSMTPYLLLLRDVFDETDAYVDDLDEELDFNTFLTMRPRARRRAERGGERERGETRGGGDVPVVARSSARRRTGGDAAAAVGASRSAPSVEEMGEIKAKRSRFAVPRTVLRRETYREGKHSPRSPPSAVTWRTSDEIQEVNKFLEIMQRQNKIMYDQNEWTVYII